MLKPESFSDAVAWFLGKRGEEGGGGRGEGKGVRYEREFQLSVAPLGEVLYEFLGEDLPLGPWNP